jgi:prevent-host-death family protein
MVRVTALELRQSLGKVVARLKKTGEPILLEKGRKPVAVLITVEQFEERFVEKAATEARTRLMAEIDVLARRSKDPTPVVELLRGARGDG